MQPAAKGRRPRPGVCRKAGQAEMACRVMFADPKMTPMGLPPGARAIQPPSMTPLPRRQERPDKGDDSRLVFTDGVG